MKKRKLLERRPFLVKTTYWSPRICANYAAEITAAQVIYNMLATENCEKTL